MPGEVAKISAEALTECTAVLGATRVIPGSNHWPDYNDRGSPEQTVAAEMEPGSALLNLGPGRARGRRRPR